MQADLHIRSFRARLCAPDAEGIARCQAVQRELLDGELEAALAGVAAADEVIVLRRLQLRFTLSQRASDGDNARRWSDGLAGALRQALAQAPARELLRFRDHRQALQAFIADAALGSGERDWAWQRLGFLPARPGAGAEVSPATRRDALLRWLADDAEFGVPLLRSLLPTPVWPALLAQLADGELRGLAMGVLLRLAARATDAFTPSLAFEVSGAAEPVWSTLPARWRPAEREAAQAAWRLGGTPQRRGWALRLAWMLADPGLARRGAAAVDVAIGGVLAGATSTFGDGPEEPTHPAPSKPAGDPEPPASRSALRGAGHPAVPRAGVATARGGNLPPAGPQVGSESGPSRASAPSAFREQSASSTGPTALPPKEGAAAELDGSADGRRGAWTDYGGLLMLLPLLHGCGALALLEDEAIWPQGGLRLALHHFALTLLPQPALADDAAALAFCGWLAPSLPPGCGQAPTASQTEALAQAWAKLQQALALRLPGWPGPGRLDRVVCRRACLWVEPGWTEVHFALADVSLDLRRAALDLDPGFIPWLGTVLSYRYD